MTDADAGGRSWAGWALALGALLALGAAAHGWVFASHGELSYDTALNVQFAHLALRGWGASGLAGTTAFGDHFAPLLLLPAPAFALFPHPVTLQLVKCAVFVGGLPALALLARPTLGRRGGRVAAALVAASPLFWASLLADYHPETLAAGLIPWMLLAYERERLPACLVLATLVAAGKENLPLVVGGLGILAWFEGRGPRWWASLCGLGAGVFALAVLVVLPAARPEGSLLTGLYEPLRTAAGWGETLTRGSLWRWLALLLLSCGGLCLVTPRKLWPAAPLLLQHGLSAREAERALDFHYLAPVAPLLAYAAIAGAARLRERAAQGRAPAGGLRAALVVALGTGLVGTLIGVPEHGPGGWRLAGPRARLGALRPQPGAARLASAIPAGAPAWCSVSTACRLAVRERLFLVESLASGTYLERPGRFDPARDLGAEPPRHGLIDARDLARPALPAGLSPLDAVGDLVLLGPGEPAVLRRLEPNEGAPNSWTPLAEGVSVQAGEGGAFRVRLERPSATLPLVRLVLVGEGDGVLGRYAHRLLYGLAGGSGAWEVRYRPPDFEGGAPAPSRLLAQVGVRRVLLTTYGG